MPTKDINGMTKFGRQTELISLIKDAKDTGVSKKDLSNIWSCKSTLARDLSELISKGIVRRETDNSNHAFFFYVDREKEMDKNLAKNRNNEGYSDPTASLAIKSVDDAAPDLIPGEIVEHRLSNGDTYDFLILNTHGDNATGFRLCEAWADAGNNPYSMRVHSVYKNYYIDLSRLTTVPVRYLSYSYQELASPGLKDIRNAVAEYLLIEPETEKVEVPVEVIKEVEVPVEAASSDILKENEILKAKIEVYKEAFAAFGKGVI